MVKNTVAKKDFIFLRIISKFKRQGIKDLIKATVITILQIVYRSSFFRIFINQNTTRKIVFVVNCGYLPNYHNPKTLNEKLLIKKIYHPHKLSHIVTDKWRVRDYVKEKGLEYILNEVYHITENPPSIPFNKLPNEFVIKSNYSGSSEQVILIYEKSQLNYEKIIKTCDNWMNINEINNRQHSDPIVSKIKSLIIVEKLLKERNFNFPLDYKYYIFGRRIQFIEVIQGRFQNGPYATIYNSDWMRSNFTHGHPSGEDINKPKNLAEMNEIALLLSSDFRFARVDLYNLDGRKIIFGEITLNPGILPFKPREYDEVFGELF